MKKCIAMILTIAMCLSLMTITAFADDDVETGIYGDAEWTLDSEGILTVSGNGAVGTGWKWNVPYSWRENVVTVVIENGITSIKNNAFAGCSMTEVILPDSLTMIGNMAFDGCTNLNSIRVPDNVVSIGQNAFSNCYSLNSVILPEGITHIDWNTFSYCESLTSITIPDTVSVINCSAFMGCASLEYIELPASIVEIRDSAFFDCSSLKSISITSGVEKIDNFVFCGCSELAEVNIPNTVRSIGGCAFSGCTSLQSIVIPEGVTTIHENAFSGCTSLQNISLPSTLTTIGSNVFSDCGNLTTVNVAAGNPYISVDDQFAVYNSDKSTLIAGPNDATVYTLPATVTSIGSSAFELNNSLIEIHIHNNLTRIEANAFCSVYELTQVIYDGTEEEWNNIYVDYGNESLLNADIICLGSQVEPLAIVTQPVSVEAYYGDSAEFAVEATGDGLTYQWQFMTTSSNSWRDNTPTTTGYNTATLTVEATAARNGYKYRCVITDAAENSVITDEVTLTTKSPIVIISQPVDATAEIGATAEFAVVAEGNGLSYQWQYKTTTGSWRDSTSATEGYNSAVLKVIAEEKRNGYSYRCIITDAMNHSVTTDAVTYTVVAAAANETPETNEDPTAKKMLGAKAPAIVITAQPADIEAINGSIAVFTVAAEGEGLTYQWQYNTPSNGSWRNSTSATDGYNTDTLSVQAADGRNGYGYRCVVSDANGNHVTTAEVRLTIKAAIVITAQPADAAAELGDTAVFAVNAEGNGLTYQWQYKTTTGSWKNSSAATDGYNTAVLNVIAEAKRDGYSYRCIITDANGNRVTSEAAVLNIQ